MPARPTELIEGEPYCFELQGPAASCPVVLHRLRGSKYGPSSGDQLDEQYHYSDDQQQVNQAAGNVKSEPKQPQDEQNRKNGPKHSTVSNSVRGTSAFIF